MRAFLHNLKRTTALAAAIAVAAFVWQRTGEPPVPTYVFDASGNRYQVHLAPITLLAQIGIMIVSALLSYALAPKPPKPKPAALSEFEIPQSKEGQPICWIFGECYVPDATLAFWGNLTNAPIKSKSGKK